MAVGLKILRMRGKEYFIDERLNEIRNVKNPSDYEPVSPELIHFWVNHCKMKGERLVCELDTLKLPQAEKVEFSGRLPYGYEKMGGSEWIKGRAPPVETEFKEAIDEGRMSVAAIENAIRIAKEMYAEGESKEEILDTLSKTFEGKTSELRRMVDIAVLRK